MPLQTDRRRRTPNPSRVLNYTTTIDPQKSLGEIQSILVAHGARSYTVLFDNDRHVEGFSFTVDVGDVERAFVFKANIARVRQRMIAAHNKGKHKWDRHYWCEPSESEPYQSNTVPTGVDDQARRTAWRILKDAIEVLMNLADAGIADTGQILFGFAMLNSGTTIFEQFEETQKRLPERV